MKTSSLITRLRQHAEPNVLGEDVSNLLEMAAAELEEEYATVEKLESELRIKEAALDHCREVGKQEIEKLQLALIARDALEKIDG